MTLEEKRLTTPPKWVNPCGLASEDFVGDLDVVQLPDEQLIQQIVLQAKQALYHLERFRDRYVSILKFYDMYFSKQKHCNAKTRDIGSLKPKD